MALRSAYRSIARGPRGRAMRRTRNLREKSDRGCLVPVENGEEMRQVQGFEHAMSSTPRRAGESLVEYMQRLQAVPKPVAVEWDPRLPYKD